MRAPSLPSLAGAVGLAIALVTAHALAAGMASVGEITIHDPWVRASLGNAPNSAAYMRLEDTGNEADRLIGGSTMAAEEVQLHTHLMENGIAKMRPVEAIEVAPGTPTVLQPGGLHIMLVGLTGPLEEGSTISLTLTFERAGEVTLDVPVAGLAGPASMSHEEMEHGPGEDTHD